MFSVVECLAMAVPIFALAYTLERKFPKIPYMHTIMTTLMASVSHHHYWSQTWDLSTESLAQAADPFTEHVLHFAVAYMIADFVLLAFFSTLPFSERLMYLVHHVAAGHSLGFAVVFERYGRMMLFFITCEISNVFLNGREILPKKMAVGKMVADLLFVVGFLGYRMCYLFPVLLRCMRDAYLSSYFDMFLLGGSVVLGPMHIYWTYLVFRGIAETLGLVKPSTPVVPQGEAGAVASSSLEDKATSSVTRPAAGTRKKVD